MQEIQIYTAGTIWFGAMPGQAIHEREFNDHEKAVTGAVQHQLESYHYVKVDRKVNELHALKRPIFLDSGAFSAHTLGVSLDIDEYCDYIKRNRDFIRVEDGALMASVLDGIGDAQLTYDNQKYMESQGVKPLPCFHSNEDERYLDYYVANYEYITLGGMVGGGTAQLMKWLDRIWDRHILDGAGRPKTKVHGFGITSIPLMERYPWYSCDSSSWVQTASFGGIQMPDGSVVSTSDRSPSRHDMGQHYLTVTELERQALDRTIRAAGFEPQRLVESAYPRIAFNLWAYREMERRINEKKRAGYTEPLVQELF